MASEMGASVTGIRNPYKSCHTCSWENLGENGSVTGHLGENLGKDFNRKGSKYDNRERAPHSIARFSILCRFKGEEVFLVRRHPHTVTCSGLRVNYYVQSTAPVHGPIHHRLYTWAVLVNHSSFPLPYHQPTLHHPPFYEQTIDSRLHISRPSSHGLLVLLKLVIQLPTNYQ